MMVLSLKPGESPLVELVVWVLLPPPVELLERTLVTEVTV